MTPRAAPGRRGRAALAPALLGAALFASLPAFGQVPAQLPAGVDPARLPGQAPAAPQVPGALPPEPVAPIAPSPGAPVGAERLRFTLTALEIEGVTAYPPGTFAPLFAHLLGTEVAVADLYAIADAITERYRADGYIISRALVPAQRIEGGAARLAVVEGFVAEVSVTGAAEPELAARAERAAMAVRPLTLRALERSILLLNDLPGVRAQGMIEPAPSGPPGAARLAVTAESRRAWDGYLALDNRGSRYVGPWQASAGGSVSSVIRAYDRMAFRVVGASPLRELRYGEIGYETPVGPDGWVIAASAFLSRSQPGFTLAPLDVEGQSVGVSVGASYPIVRSRAENLRASFAFTPYDSTNDVLGRSDVAPAYDDNIRPLRAALSYDLADGWGGFNFATAELSQGLDALGASPENRTNASRPGARSRFTRLVVEASRTQALDALYPGFGVFVAARGQWSFGAPLVAFEQFGLGGARFGRGYDPSEIAGDNGIAASVELQWSAGFLPGWYTFGREATVQPYLFYDVGIVSNATAGQASQSLASAGLGIRLWLGEAVAAAVELAKPLTRDVAAEVLAGNSGNEPRLYLSTVVRF
ncbi:ShlB/FhaC/HecB family hemolysin secretion/activation protein [Elioraea rosea]|uniref:ShlB/FhaC/HecB family hemolysin secretion/activation protein n=1 Tax=Elioraea rosea TaxID=2492390 RepID=UPI0011839E53|nr:ShlB/FhaC/HecB family hemolysin secretion/activation protein [Elioraea rosea]